MTQIKEPQSILDQKIKHVQKEWYDIDAFLDWIKTEAHEGNINIGDLKEIDNIKILKQYCDIDQPSRFYS